MKKLIAVLTIFVSVNTYGEEAIDRLLDAKFFGFGGIGYSAELSPYQDDFNSLSTKPNREELYLKLTASDNPNAQAYGLLGLYSIGSKNYEKLRKELCESGSRPTNAEGCLIGPIPMKELVEGFESWKVEKNETK